MFFNKLLFYIVYFLILLENKRSAIMLLRPALALNTHIRQGVAFMARRNTNIETRLQMRCVAWLRKVIFYGACTHLSFIKFTSSSEINAKNANKAVKMGYCKGILDLQLQWAYKDGTKDFGYIEFKRPKTGDLKAGTLEDSQIVFIEDCERAGQKYAVAYTIQEFQNALEDFGILKKP